MFSKNIYIFLFYCLTPISNPKPLNKEQGYPPSTRFFHTLQIIVLVFIYLKIKVKPIKACDRTTQLDTCGLYMFKCLHFSNPKLSTAPRVTMRNSQEHFFGYNFEWLQMNPNQLGYINCLASKVRMPTSPSTLMIYLFCPYFLTQKKCPLYIYHKHVPPKKSHPLILSPSKGSRCNSPHNLNYDYLLYNPILIHKRKIPLISLDVMVDTIGFGEL